MTPPIAPQDIAAIRAALQVARRAGMHDEIPVGAIVLDPDGTMVGEGHNTRVVDQDPTAHAEIVALRRAGARLGSWNLDGCTLAVTLEPCTMCAGAIVAARIARVVFGAWDSKAGAMGSLWDVARDRRLNHRPEVVGGVLEDECGALLEDFFAGRRISSGAVEIRSANAADAPLLIEMTAAAADWRDSGSPATSAVLDDHHLARYVEHWPRIGDVGVIALIDGVAIGAAWARPLPAHNAGYGFVSPDVPELVIGIRAGHRGQGAGGALLDALIETLAGDGCAALSLSVEDGNPARRLYERHGFATVGRNGNADTMVRQLR